MNSNKDKEACVLTDLLEQLQVPCTYDYTVKRYREMPFQSLFGFANLLKEYKVDSHGYTLDDKDLLRDLDTPYLAQTRCGFIIVTGFDGDKVSYISEGVPMTINFEELKRVSTGMVFMAFPTDESCEPDYATHRRNLFITKAKRWVLGACLLFLFAYLFISNSIYQSPALIAVMLFDFAGLFFTTMLMKKMLNIKSSIADRVCGVLQQGGCDDILKTNVAKFFGIFSWSEVGFSYFSVSLLTLLIFPQWVCYLALCNVCCLPYTVWSIWYQRFRAHTWCALCVCVQATLWLLFFSYLAAGSFHGIFPLKIELFVLGASYVTVLLALNRLSPHLDKNE